MRRVPGDLQVVSAAAVAAGVHSCSGLDTGGSIRQPSPLLWRVVA